MKPADVVIMGAGGHARVVADVIRCDGRYRISHVVDERADAPGTALGAPLLPGGDALLDLPAATRPRLAIVGIGSNAVRLRLATWLRDHGFELVTVVHPAATVAGDVVLGRGTVVMPGAVINVGTRVGDSCIVNTRASIDHDGDIGHGVHIAPGATLCGGVRVGDGSFVCAGATIIPYRSIGARATVAAGATVIRDVGDDVTVAGTPARPLTRNEP